MVIASWLKPLRRRWSELLRWISRPRVAASRDALPASPARRPAPAPPRAASPEPAAVAVDLTITQPERPPLVERIPPPSRVIVRASATSRGSGGSSTASGSLPVAADRVVERPAEIVPPAPVAARTGSPVTALRDAEQGQLSVRLFFSRMLAATPEGLTIDFTRWQTASVERFFLAITSPGLIRRREAPTTGDERLTLPTAFEGFEWD